MTLEFIIRINMLSGLKPEVRVSEDDTEIELSIPAFGLHNLYNPGNIFQR